MPGRKKRGSRNLKIMLSAMGITVLALLILALAAYLLIGGKAVSSGTESEQADQETDVNEEDPESLYEPEENGEKVAVSTVKKIASETDKRTVGIDVSEFQGTGGGFGCGIRYDPLWLSVAWQWRDPGRCLRTV